MVISIQWKVEIGSLLCPCLNTEHSLTIHSQKLLLNLVLEMSQSKISRLPSGLVPLVADENWKKWNILELSGDLKESLD